LTNPRNKLLPAKKGRNPLRTHEEARTEAEDFMRRQKAKVLKGDPEALDWARRTFKHWHEVGIGCGPDCLKGIVYRPDPEARR